MQPAPPISSNTSLLVQNANSPLTTPIYIGRPLPCIPQSLAYALRSSPFTMNLGDLDLHRVHHDRPQIQRVLSSDRPVTPLAVRLESDTPSPSRTSTLSSEPETVIRWQTPPSRSYTPQQRSEDTLRSEDTIRKQGTIRSDVTVRPAGHRHSAGAYEPAYNSDTPLVERLDEDQIRSDQAQDSYRGGEMDVMSVGSSSPTPGDDTEYIRYAIDQLTRDHEGRRNQQRYSTPTGAWPASLDERIISGSSGYSTAEQEREALRLVRKHRSSPGEGRLFALNPTRPLSDDDQPLRAEAPASRRSSHPEVFIPVSLPPNSFAPNLTFVPAILRPLSMITLSCSCLLMTAALIFCAVYSSSHDSLAAWTAGIYGDRYFVFSFLPQILAACVFLYVQCAVAAITRIMPFAMMALPSAESRSNALFLGLFPRSMLWPRWDGPVSMNLANLFFWLSIFTIPLQGCLFSATKVDGMWRWTAVQGVAWTLVAIYLLILIAASITGLFFRRTTGLMWDPRSLADLIALLPTSNSLRDYPGTDVMWNVEDIRHKLSLRSDRLGYWRTPNKDRGIFYCIGEEGASTRQYTLQSGKIQEKIRTNADVEKSELYSSNTRFRYIPWFLKDTFVVSWAVAAFILLVALFVVSFLPSTAIRKGFAPQVPVLPNSAGFSPANFLYSFVPSTIGMFIYLSFQPIDMALRKLQPWAELGKPAGASAERSLLLDYPARLPISCSVQAFTNGHYRVAILSLLSTLFLLIPILAGGLFFPLTTPANVVRMIPNLSSFYIILTLLCLYLLALLLLLPHRQLMYLPHGVDCLAEIFSFVYGSQILSDSAFQKLKSRTDLVTRLTGARQGWPPTERGERNQFAFGVYSGRAGGECLGIERLGRRGTQEVVILSKR
ncbi:hypothetical protein PZA11_006808 [Diplocarpon coronariae]|uniref:Phosphoribosylaminoimidazole-succinocarboxamide synthase n=1 Tax=Diplocarpon coronariae TaxID=2795749 RepID=A0A218ZFD4_9HELO|nr:hypothetical protein B2J93_2 [Marssonina coronariae]